jgi:two-component system chemotaxis response regulator CheY
MNTCVQDLDSSVIMKSHHCLLVANVSMRKIMRSLLQGMSIEFGTIIEAGDATQAMHYLDNIQAQSWLVFIELDIPHVNGLSLLQEIRSHAQFEHSPVIVFFGQATEQTMIKILRLGIDDCIVMPFSQMTFINKLEKLSHRITSALNHVADVRLKRGMRLTRLQDQ